MSKEIALKRIKRAVENKYNFLDLSLLKLTEIPVEIAQLPNLEYLFLDHNKIVDLGPLWKLEKLKTLSVSHNKIESVPVFVLEQGVPLLWKDNSVLFFFQNS